MGDHRGAERALSSNVEVARQWLVTTIPVEAARLDRAAGAQDRPSPLARAVGARFDALLAARGMRCCKWIRLLAVAAALQIIPVSRGFPFLRGDGRNRRTDASPGGPLVGTLSSASLAAHDTEQRR